MIHVVQFSGGKDSTALVLWACEEFGADGFVPLFADTGWEHVLTMAYIEHVNRRVLSGRLETCRSEKYPNGMISLVELRNRIPSATRRFCTEELKVRPSIQYIRELELRHNDSVTVYQGIRADESASRREAGRRLWDDRYDCWIERPLYDWTAEQVFDMHAKYELEPNPLYTLGASRVGCFPCIMINHGELRRLSITLPEVWDRAEQLEAAAHGRSMFPPNYIPERFCSRVVTAKDGRIVRVPTLADVRAYVTQPNQPAFWDDEPRSCMSVYNLCE